jgi:acetylglutamate kinase
LRILIKLGGTLLDSAESRNRLAGEIAAVARDGHQVVVVHGGGKQMTRYLTAQGIDSTFVNGLRITTSEVLDAVLKILAGTVNKELVAAFVAAGAGAVGLTGIDALLAEAEPMSPELGFVGRTVGSDARLLEVLTGNGYLPVVACVAGDRTGQIYNVNADQMAVACAASFHAAKLLFLTDVDGVRGANSETLAYLTPEQGAGLIASGVASGGMEAKLNAATEALLGGVTEVAIAPGALPGVVKRLMAGEAIGTLFVAVRALSR